MKTSVLIPMVVLVLTGCTSKSTETVRLADASEAQVELKGGVPVEFRTPDGQVIPFRNGEVVFGDQIAVVVPNAAPGTNRVEVFRQPQVVNRQLDALPYTYMKTGSLQQVVTQGGRGEPYVDPTDGKFCWSARVCRDPDCPSQTPGSAAKPTLFIHEIRGVVVRSDGKLDWSGAKVEDIQSPPRCPVCGGHAYVELYDPADVAQRKQALAKELSSVRAARDAAQALQP